MPEFGWSQIVAAPLDTAYILQLVSPICVTCPLTIEFAIPGLDYEGIIDAGARRTSRCNEALAFLLVRSEFAFLIYTKSSSSK